MHLQGKWDLLHGSFTMPNPYPHTGVSRRIAIKNEQTPNQQQKPSCPYKKSTSHPSQSDTSGVKPWTYKQHLYTLHGKECNLTIQFIHSPITSFCYSWCFEILWPKMRSLCWVLSMVCAPRVHSPAALLLGTPWCSLMGSCHRSHPGFGSRCWPKSLDIG